MEKINITNYEAFFLDFIEGNLDEAQQIDLHQFLLDFPELKLELDEFEPVKLEEDKFSNKKLKNSLLKEEKTLLPLVDYLMIAEVEGTITTKEKAQLAKLVKADSTLMNELSIYHKTKLVDATAVVFPLKSKLIQKERKGIVWWQYASAVAAAVVLVFLWNGQNTERYYSPRTNVYSAINEQEFNDSLESKSLLEKVNTKEVISIEENTNQFADVPKKGLKQVQLDAAKLNETDMQVSAENQLAINNAQPNSDDKKLEETDPKKIDLKKQVQDIEKNKVENAEQNQVEENQENNLAEVPTVVLNSSNEEFIPIAKFAKNKYKTDLLKGKTFSETIIEEIATVTKDKIIIDRKKDSDGNTQKFAINIGKFSFSRNR